MSDKILEIIYEDVDVVDGSVLSVVQYPFHYETKTYHVVYLAKTTPWNGAALNPVKHQHYTIVYHELDNWLSNFVSCKNWALWPVAAEGVANVLYREEQFGKLSLYATECITLRFFEDRAERVHDIEKVLLYMDNSILSVKDTAKIVEPFILDLASAIHFARTGDLETDYYVLRQHFQETDYWNLIEVSDTYPENSYLWAENISHKVQDLAGELKGAITCSSIDWQVDLTRLARLGQLAMEFRHLA